MVECYDLANLVMVPDVRYHHLSLPLNAYTGHNNFKSLE